jgi:hypothetical protein
MHLLMYTDIKFQGGGGGEGGTWGLKKIIGVELS